MQRARHWALVFWAILAGTCPLELEKRVQAEAAPEPEIAPEPEAVAEPWPVFAEISRWG